MSTGEPNTCSGFGGPIQADVTDSGSNYWDICVSGNNNTIAISCNHGSNFALHNCRQLNSVRSSIQSFHTADEGAEISSSKRLSHSCRWAHEVIQAVSRQLNSQLCPCLDCHQLLQRIGPFCAGIADAGFLRTALEMHPDSTSAQFSFDTETEDDYPSLLPACDSINNPACRLIFEDSRGFSLFSLSSADTWWRDHYNWLEEQGYQLRPQYKSERKVSFWEDDDAEYKQSFEHVNIVDAISYKPHRNDLSLHPHPQPVYIKRVSRRGFSLEVQIMRDFGTGKRAADDRNHCIPILDVLTADNEWDMLVMPSLVPFTSAMWKNSLEVIDFVGQLFQGLKYMHRRGLAYRGCFETAIYQGDLHSETNRGLFRKAKSPSKSKTRPKYYYADFSSSCYYRPGQFADASTDSTANQLKLAPELRNRARRSVYDPFAVDVYMLGHALSTTLQKELRQWKQDLMFIQALLSRMTDRDPSKRPTMAQVDSRFDCCRVMVVCGLPLAKP